MALEAVIFQQDPFNISSNSFKDNASAYSLGGGFPVPSAPLLQQQQGSSSEYWDHSMPAPGLMVAPSSSQETCGDPVDDGLLSGGVMAPVARRKRRRTKSMKNKEEMENQRMTHIAVERNRRRQMNDYLAVLRSLMPPSYAQRGDQASIVGGAINFVKELEQLLQSLEAHSTSKNQHSNPNPNPNPAHTNLFSNFFSFPQYSTSPTATATTTTTTTMDTAAEKRSEIADIEVTMVESHANIKILTSRRPKQLLKLVAGFQSISLAILHLSITTVDQSVLYTFSVKVEDECQLNTVNEMATTVHDILRMIQEEVSIQSSCQI